MFKLPNIANNNYTINNKRTFLIPVIKYNDFTYWNK